MKKPEKFIKEKHYFDFYYQGKGIVSLKDIFDHINHELGEEVALSDIVLDTVSTLGKVEGYYYTYKEDPKYSEKMEKYKEYLRNRKETELKKAMELLNEHGYKVEQ